MKAAPNAALLTFAELIVNETRQRVGCRLLIRAVDFDFHNGAYPSSQHHHSHDAFGIDATFVADHEDITLETTSQLGEFGRSSGMQAELIANGERRFYHLRLF